MSQLLKFRELRYIWYSMGEKRFREDTYIENAPYIRLQMIKFKETIENALKQPQNDEHIGFKKGFNFWIF